LSLPVVAEQAPAARVRRRRTTLPLRDFSCWTSSVRSALCCSSTARLARAWSRFGASLENGAEFLCGWTFPLTVLGASLSEALEPAGQRWRYAEPKTWRLL